MRLMLHLVGIFTPLTVEFCQLFLEFCREMELDIQLPLRCQLHIMHIMLAGVLKKEEQLLGG